MSEETIIMDGSNPKKENAERTKIVNSSNFKNDFVEKQKEQSKKMKALKSLAFMAGGAGIAGIAMGFMPSDENFDSKQPILVPNDPRQAVGVNDQMSYNEAWQVARAEVGQGGYFVWHNQEFPTYTQEEWRSLDTNDQKDFEQHIHQDHIENVKLEANNQYNQHTAFVVHDVAPVVHSVSDDMSFNDAFAIARQEVGAGGVFKWHGKLYGTYYKNEWSKMSAEDKHDFEESYQNVVSNDSTVHHSEVEETPHSEVVINESEEVFMRDEMVTTQDGNKVHIGYFKHGNEVIVKVDSNNDNQYDYIVDREHNQLIGLNGNQDIDLNQLENQHTAVEPIRSENVQIQGYDALVTTYSDGHQEAKIDIDGDGKFDTKLSVDTNGHMELYDNSGNLIAEQDIKIDDPAMHESEVTPDEPDHELIDTQLVDNDFDEDFDNTGDVSDWINDDLV